LAFIPAINKILREHIGVRKLTSRRVPHLLKPEQKQARVDWCTQMLEKYGGGTSKSVSDILTCDEAWVYCYEPERKCQSQVWAFPDEVPPTKVVRGRSTGKQMVASFFRHSGHVASIRLENQRTVTAAWYTGICFPQVIQCLSRTRPKCVARSLTTPSRQR
jgi:histone-lysine N-methyltransferase SETMAR